MTRLSPKSQGCSPRRMRFESSKTTPAAVHVLVRTRLSGRRRCNRMRDVAHSAVSLQGGDPSDAIFQAATLTLQGGQRKTCAAQKQLSNNFRESEKSSNVFHVFHVFCLGAQCSGMAYPMGMDAFGMMGGMGCGMMGVWCLIVLSFARSKMICCGCMLCTDGKNIKCRSVSCLRCAFSFHRVTSSQTSQLLRSQTAHAALR